MTDLAGTTSVPVNHGGRQNGLSLFDMALMSIAGFFGMLMLILSVALSGMGSHNGFMTVIVSFSMCIIGIIALTRPRWIFYGYISLCMIFPHELEEIFIPLGFMKVYPQDALFVFLIILCTLRAVWGKVKLHELRFNRLMIVYILLGVWAAGVGLFITGNEYDNVFGDFRRSFFYFLAYFFALMLTTKPEDIRFLKMAVIVGSAGAIIKGFVMFGLGDFVTRRFGDAAHIMTHFEVTFSTFLVFLGLTHLTFGTRRPIMWIGLALAGGLIVVLGNFRTCWVGLLAGLIMMLFLLPMRQRSRLVAAMAVAAISGAIGLAILWDVPVSETHSTVGENVAQKADLGSMGDDTNVTWRMDSYRNAFELWQTQPIIGRGLGEELEFATTTSTGHPTMAIGHRVHNSYLWFFMSVGVLGFALLIYIQWRYVRTVIRGLRLANLSKRSRITLISFTAFYTAILTCACFDVYLESPPPITMLSVTMAICLMTIRYADGEV